MIELNVNDTHLLENIKMIKDMQSQGYSDQEIQERYNEMVAKDIGG